MKGLIARLGGLAEEWRPDRNRALRAALIRAALIVAALNLVAAAIVFHARAREVKLGVLFRDPAAQFEFPPYAGFFFHLGILALTATAAICLFAVPLARGGEGRTLRFGGLLTGLLVLDDFFMIHDWLFPEVIGLPETVPFAFYVVLALGLVQAIGAAAFGPRFALFWLALAFLGLSLALDVSGFGGIWNLLMEDMAKLCGFVLWSLFWTGHARAAIGRGHAYFP